MLIKADSKEEFVMIRSLSALLLCVAFASPAVAATGDVARLRAAIVAARAQAGLAKPAASGDAKGVAITPDQSRLLVNKPLGSDRWAVTWDDHDQNNQDITGNVITADGITFLFCPITGATGPDPQTDSIMIHCSSGDGIVGPQDWQDLGDFTIPGSFFLP
jgi:hypothetical protein